MDLLAPAEATSTAAGRAEARDSLALRETDGAALLAATPLQLARWLCSACGDLPGFDNSDRAALRKIGRGADGAVELPLVLAMCRQAILGRADSIAVQQACRPEAALLTTVHYLLKRAVALEARQAQAQAGGALAHAEADSARQP